MFGSDIKFRFTRRHERLLHKTTINEEGPGTILHDFEALLSYVSQKKLRVTKKYNLRLADVRKINDLFTNPLQIGLTRPQQKSYPHVHGLYLLLRTSGLTYVDDTGKNPILHINQTAYQAWQALNPTERYMTQFEIWLTRTDPELIDERPGLFTIRGGFYSWAVLFNKFSNQKGQASNIENLDNSIRTLHGSYNLGILDAFGFVNAEFGPPKTKTSWYLKRLEQTPLGEAMFSLLMARLKDGVEEVLFSDHEDNAPVNDLQPTLQPYFPEWQNSFTLLSPEAALVEDTHIFRVSLGNIWRRIAMPANYHLDIFADTILQSVDFDRDHLYSFTYRSRFGAKEEIFHPYMREGIPANEVEIGELSLYVGQTMTFLFDFGDNWEFKITLEQVDPTMEIDRPVLLESHGEAPEQYPSWDEEEEWM